MLLIWLVCLTWLARLIWLVITAVLELALILYGTGHEVSGWNCIAFIDRQSSAFGETSFRPSYLKHKISTQSHINEKRFISC